MQGQDRPTVRDKTSNNFFVLAIHQRVGVSRQVGNIIIIPYSMIDITTMVMMKQQVLVLVMEVTAVQHGMVALILIVVIREYVFLLFRQMIMP